jgi:predicted hydrolase (HD superfamily)
MKDKAFAAKVNREDILRGADELIDEVITALRQAAAQLGLEGNRTTTV